MELRLAQGALSLRQPLIMAIVNATPNSFSDGGRYLNPQAAIEHGLELLEQGAHILDIGGESTHPGAQPVETAQEMERIVPVIEGLRKHTQAPISVDTYRAPTAEAAILAGADIINDISAGSDPHMFEVAARLRAGLVLMHMQGKPATMQQRPFYNDVVAQVAGYLQARAEQAQAAGISRQSLLLDPGIGFGKNLEHNLELMRHLPAIVKLGLPVLLGISRKRFLAALSGEEFGGAGANLAANLWGLMAGVKILRVHEVAMLKQACMVWQAIAN